jgi:hypothetical protein
MEPYDHTMFVRILYITIHHMSGSHILKPGGRRPWRFSLVYADVCLRILLSTDPAVGQQLDSEHEQADDWPGWKTDIRKLCRHHTRHSWVTIGKPGRVRVWVPSPAMRPMPRPEAEGLAQPQLRHQGHHQ